MWLREDAKFLISCLILFLIAAIFGLTLVIMEHCQADRVPEETIVLVYTDHEAGETVTVRGAVYQSHGLVGIEGVRLQAYRDGPLLAEPVITDSRGLFEFEVRAGDPFSVQVLDVHR